MDRRQRKSRNAIFSAFNRLIARKSYAAITVTEIIEEADVGRTTFYAHFQTKDDLLGELSKEILDHVFSTSLWNEGSHDFSSEEKSYEHLVSHILYHLREGSMNIRRILSSDCSSIFLRHLQERFSMYLEDCIEKEKDLPVPRRYAICMLSSCLLATISWWVENGMKDKPETVASYSAAFSSLPV